MKNMKLKFSEVVKIEQLMNKLQDVKSLKYAILRNKLTIQKYIDEHNQCLAMYSEEFLKEFREDMEKFYELNRTEFETAKVSFETYMNAEFSTWIGSKEDYMKRLNEEVDVEFYTVDISKLENEDFDVDSVAILSKYFIITNNG